jgi:hypothetical protein
MRNIFLIQRISTKMVLHIHRIRLAPTSGSAKKVGETNLITLVEGYVVYVPPYYLIDLQKSRISADKKSLRNNKLIRLIRAWPLLLLGY